jgi:hypothetical protein
MKQFTDSNRDDLLTFYWSDNAFSKENACIEFEFTVCDWVPNLVTNTFSREICIQNGKSIGCVFEVTKNAVVAEIDEINFTFDWEEIDCSDDCTADNYVITEDRYDYIQNEMLELCDLSVGSFRDITNGFPVVGSANWREEPILNSDGTVSNVIMVVNHSSDRDIVASWGASGASITIPAASRYLIALPENTTINNLTVDGSLRAARTTEAITGCN